LFLKDVPHISSQVNDKWIRSLPFKTFFLLSSLFTILIYQEDNVRADTNEKFIL